MKNVLTNVKAYRTSLLFLIAILLVLAGILVSIAAKSSIKHKPTIAGQIFASICKRCPL